MKTAHTLWAALIALAFLGCDGNAADTPTVSKVSKSLLTGQPETRIITTTYPKPGREVTQAEAKAAADATKERWMEEFMMRVRVRNLVENPYLVNRLPHGFIPMVVPEGAVAMMGLAVVEMVIPAKVEHCTTCKSNHECTWLALRNAAIYDDGGILAYGLSFPAFAPKDFDPSTQFVWCYDSFHPVSKQPHYISRSKFDKDTERQEIEIIEFDVAAEPFIPKPASTPTETIVTLGAGG
jgi:hypothetical protein